MRVVASKVLAGSFALAGFAVAIVSGLASDNPAAQILLRATIAMVVCYVIGSIVGLICERVIVKHVEASEKISTQAPAAGATSAAEISANDKEEPIVV